VSAKSEKAIAVENKAYNCAQKVFGAFCEQYDVSTNQALRATSSLGGGLRAGESCGALVGALLVVGLKYGTADINEIEQRSLCDEKSRELSAKFKAMNKYITCRDILGMDTSVGDNRTKAKEMGLFDDVCPKIIKNIIELLEEMGY